MQCIVKIPFMCVIAAAVIIHNFYSAQKSATGQKKLSNPAISLVQNQAPLPIIVYLTFMYAALQLLCTG